MISGILFIILEIENFKRNFIKKFNGNLPEVDDSTPFDAFWEIVFPIESFIGSLIFANLVGKNLPAYRLP